MPNLVNIHIADIILNLIRVHFFFKSPPFLVYTRVHQHILVIKNTYIEDLGKGQTQRLDDTTVTAKAKYSVNFNELKNFG